MAELSLVLKLANQATKIMVKGEGKKSTREILESNVKSLVSLVEEIEKYNKELDRPTEEIEKLKDAIAAVQGVIRNHSRIPWWKFHLRPYYQSKLEAADKELANYISVQIQGQIERDLKKILFYLNSSDSHSSQTIPAETHTNNLASTSEGDLEIPEFTVGLETISAEIHTNNGAPTSKVDLQVPEFTVGLDGPLNGLNFDLNMSGLVGYTNTALGETLLSRTPSSSSSFFASPSQSLRKYDVFISFRGDDIRSGFKSHLYDALCRKKIEAYVDDRLDKGDELWPALVTAIKDSVLFLIVFSENYASSKWCLRELTQILESTKNRRHRVMPVFYKIDPSHVRNQTGSYQVAFTEHEHNHHEEEVRKWRENLTRAANLVGWDSRTYGNEVELIRKIVTCVTKKLDTMFQSVYSDGLFGIDEQIADIESLLCNESQDVRFIGIWGATGVGKTTIATELFNKLCLEFESSCFLGNIREESGKNRISILKKKLLATLLEDDKLYMDMSSGRLANNAERRLRRKKVIIVLDDVNDPQQLINLVGAPDRFGKGSRIIMTARDKQVFGKNVNNTYEVKALSFDDALQLFKFHALNSNCFDKEFEQLSQKVIDYAIRIPSTLIALGSYLYGKSIEEWKRQLEKITKIPCTEIQQILKLSYDGIDDEKKNLLFDIASTLNDRKAEHLKKLLDAFGYSGIDGLTKILEGLIPSGQQIKKERDEKLDPTDEHIGNMDLPTDGDIQAQ